MAQLRVQAIPLTTISSAILQALVYTPINGLGLPNPCFLVRVINNSNQSITISFGGETDSDIVPANSTLDIATPINTLQNSLGAQFSKGTIIYARGTAGVGSIGVAGYFQNQP